MKPDNIETIKDRETIRLYVKVAESMSILEADYKLVRIFRTQYKYTCVYMYAKELISKLEPMEKNEVLLSIDELKELLSKIKLDDKTDSEIAQELVPKSVLVKHWRYRTNDPIALYKGKTWSEWREQYKVEAEEIALTCIIAANQKSLKEDFNYVKI